MTQTPITKSCTNCGTEYPATLEYFPPSNKNTNGMHPWCRVCLRAANKESQKNADAKTKRKMYREGRREHRELILEQQKQKRRDNPEAARKRYREYYQKNRGCLVERARERRGSKKIDDDDSYSDLTPVDKYDTFRAWAVITSSEYSAVMHHNIPNEMED